MDWGRPFDGRSAVTSMRVPTPPGGFSAWPLARVGATGFGGVAKLLSPVAVLPSTAPVGRPAPRRFARLPPTIPTEVLMLAMLLALPSAPVSC